MSLSSGEEDLDCPLCMEEIDITDRYFKPCPCGYQICRFCWNHIKENLNGLCPACRRPFSEDSVEFKPVPAEEIARIKAAKKRKERERKEQDQLAKRNLANARVVQKNLVYVLGLPPRLASEDLLKGSEYFGQYGKILRVVVNRRAHGHTPVLAQVPNTGVYITFARKEDAGKAIESVDGSVYDGMIIRATYGTTKYCSYFLKNQACPNPACQFLHEPGEEPDSFARDELSRMQMRERNPKPPPFPIAPGGKKEEDKDSSALPATASWANPVSRQSGSQYASTTASPSSIPGTPRSIAFDVEESGSQPRTPELSTADRKTSGKRRASAAEFPPGLTTSPFERLDTLPSGPLGVSVMGSKALSEDSESPEEIIPLGDSSRVICRENVAPAVSEDFWDDTHSVTAMGYMLHPKYTGPFDPFREDPLGFFADLSLMSTGGAPTHDLFEGIGAGMFSKDVGSLGIDSNIPPSENPQTSRFARFFGESQMDLNVSNGMEVNASGETQSVQESFRAMFPNVNVSFTGDGLAGAGSRWSEGVAQNIPTSVWGQGQGIDVQQQSFEGFPGEPGALSNLPGAFDLEGEPLSVDPLFGLGILPYPAPGAGFVHNLREQQLRDFALGAPGLQIRGRPPSESGFTSQHMIGSSIAPTEDEDDEAVLARQGYPTLGIVEKLRSVVPAAGTTGGASARGDFQKKGQSGHRVGVEEKSSMKAIGKQEKAIEEGSIMRGPNEVLVAISQKAGGSKEATSIRKDPPLAVETPALRKPEQKEAGSMADKSKAVNKDAVARPMPSRTPSAETSVIRPNTPVPSIAAPKISSPVPRRVLTITPARKSTPTNGAGVASETETGDKAAEPGKEKRTSQRVTGSITPKPPLDDEPVTSRDVKELRLVESAGRSESPVNSPKAKRRGGKTKVEESEKPPLVASNPVKEEALISTPVKATIESEVEVEAIVSRKTKKRKEKRIPVKRKPVVLSQPIEVPQSVTVLTPPVLVDTQTPARSTALADAPISKQVPSKPTGKEPATVAHPQPPTGNEPSEPLKTKSQSQPKKPASAKQRKADRNTATRTHEVDITSLFTTNPNGTRSVDMQINTEVLTSALSQLTAGYVYQGPHEPFPANMNVRIDVAPSGPPPKRAKSSRQPQPQPQAQPQAHAHHHHHAPADAMASFGLSSLGINVQQLDQLAASLGHLSGEYAQALADQGATPTPEGTVNVNIDGRTMNIDANTFIDQALEGLATTAAFLYEGLEAQAEKVRREEEGKGKAKAKPKTQAQHIQTKNNIQRVAEQVSKLEQYALKLQGQVHHAAGTSQGGASGAVQHATKEVGHVEGEQYTATINVPGASGTSADQREGIDMMSPIAEMFGVGLHPGTANWTTEDWKAKCRSVEVVMKRVREAREIRRQQKNHNEGGDGGARAFTDQSIDPNTLESDEDDDSYVSIDHDTGTDGIEEYPAGPAGVASSSTASSHAFENNYIQKLLDTVRLLVSNGEMLANTISPAAAATAAGRMPGNTPGRKPKIAPVQVHGPAPPPASSAQIEQYFSYGVFVDEHGRPVVSDAASMENAVREAHHHHHTHHDDHHGSIVFNPAPLLAAVASGSITPGMPIPWEMFGLRGPPVLWGAGGGHDGSGAASGVHDPLATDVHMLERELETSRREEEALEKRLLQIMQRNRQWQDEVANALKLDFQHPAGGQEHAHCCPHHHHQHHVQHLAEGDMYTSESDVLDDDADDEGYEDAMDHQGSEDDGDFDDVDEQGQPVYSEEEAVGGS